MLKLNDSPINHVISPLFTVLKMNDLNIVGVDVTEMLAKMDIQDDQFR